MVMVSIKLLLFIASMAGYVEYIKKKIEVQVEFLPIISISGITFVLFFAGILNILPHISFGLFLVGIFLFAQNLIINIKINTVNNLVLKYITPGIIIFIIANIYFIFLLKDQRLIHYDNFSHWGLVVKNMLIDDALPNFENITIEFSSYPLGSALFIYYFCSIVGISEGLALIGQIIFILSGLLTLYSFSSFQIIKKTKNIRFINIVLFIITTFISVYLLDGASSIHNLLVDTLLNTTAISLFALIYYYSETPYKIILPVTSLASSLILIKNSGMFFAFFSLIIYFFAIYIHGKKTSKRIFKITYLNIKLLMSFGAPMIVSFLWSRHVSMVFPSDKASKHAVNLESYIQNFNNKTQGEIKEISKNFLNRLNSGDTREFAGLFFLVVILLILFFFINNYLDKRLLGIVVIISVMYIFYNIGLWIMYLVSMPTSEALYLAGYERYISTIIDYLFGITTIGIIYTVNQTDSSSFRKVTTSICTLYFGYLVFSSNNIENTKSIFQRENINIGINEPTIANIDLSLDDLSSNPMKSKTDHKYLIYYPTQRSIGYERYYTSYRLYQEKVGILRSLEIIENIWRYDLMSVTLVTDELVEFFNDYSDEVPEIGTFKIDKSNKKILGKVK